jgi:hypothetical protein
VVGRAATGLRICRHYWPIALIAAVFFRRCRHPRADPQWSTAWSTGPPATVVHDGVKRVGLLAYLLLKRLDDLAYGLGLWEGVLRERHLGALKPQIRT